MALWTDVIEPETLTGYARESLSLYEASKGTLGAYLPDRYVGDISAKFYTGESGLVDAAAFRAFDAEPEIGDKQQVKAVTIDLPAIGKTIPVSEYNQLRARSGQPTDEAVQRMILASTTTAVQAIADAIEYMRGRVLVTGKATIDQPNFVSVDDFGRKPELTIASGTAASEFTADPLGYLETLEDLYEEINGEKPGSWVVSRKVIRALQAHDSLKTALVGGGSRSATLAEVNNAVEGRGIAPLTVYTRKVKVGGKRVEVVPNGTALALPAPVATDDPMGTDLGATVWGRTLTSTDAEWAIADQDQPGIVAGVWRNDKPPMGAEVIADAIGLPVLANANLSLAVQLVA